MPPIPSEKEMVESHIQVFQQIMLNILQRRSIFRSLENSIIGKPAEIESNFFVKFYAFDYLRAQLTDIRKFFENDSKSYKISTITNNLTDKSMKDTHTEMYTNRWKKDDEWEMSLSDLANKMIMHAEIGYLSPDVYTNQLDFFIDELNTFLDELVRAVTAARYNVGYLDRSPNSDFLVNKQREDFEEFLKIASEQ
jgi:hypothetical protein